jgi:hypothetical protein
MKADLNIEQIDAEIQAIKNAAQALEQLGEQIPAVNRNARRILASTKMLEINISDVIAISEVTK